MLALELEEYESLLELSCFGKRYLFDWLVVPKAVL